jgi:hypothetical protein
MRGGGSLNGFVARCGPAQSRGSASFAVVDDHIYSDQAQSGARRDRLGLSALIAAGQQVHFEVVLVDDLSRLARDNYLMLSVIAELHFEGVRVISVADGLDSEDEEATLGIQIRGIFNELQLQDLRKKTLRGQIGQKRASFFGCSPHMPTALRFPASSGRSMRVPGRFRSATGWSPATVSRMLDNEKYVGRWAWNRTATRRDPRTGTRRRFPKPKSEWIIHEDDELRIVPLELWERVRARRKEVGKAWPGGKGRRGFSRDQKGQQRHFPTHLLSGAMTCGRCGAAIAQVSGKGGGYYGCLGAAKGACDNKMLVRRKLAESVILGALAEQLTRAEQIRHVIERVEAEVAKLSEHLPETIRSRSPSSPPRSAASPTSSTSSVRDLAARRSPMPSSRRSAGSRRSARSWRPYPGAERRCSRHRPWSGSRSA